MYLILQENGRVEVWDLGVYRFAEHFVLDVVHELAHLCRLSATFINTGLERVPKTWSGGPKDDAPPNPPRPACELAMAFAKPRAGLRTSTGSEATPSASETASSTSSGCAAE
jgi:hypothetical protein